ncbi:MAG: cell division initiation protein [Pseudonocardiales bacterium]|nr:MAG: cell division initiation protein [Pseudonocardiales bacterium]
MPLTPADVHNVTFSKPPIGKRGYSEDEVDVFLDLVGAELARLIQKNKDLRNQVEPLDQHRAVPVATGSRPRPLDLPHSMRGSVRPWVKAKTSPGPEHDVQAAKVLAMAQQVADLLTGDAKAQVDGVLGEARIKSERLLADTRAKADDMVNEARTRAETMLNDARTTAEALGRQSREKAASLKRDAAREHAEIIGSISQEKSVLHKKVDELRIFERDYRNHLMTCLESQLLQLDRHAPAALADTTRNPQQVVAAWFGDPADSGSHLSEPS